MDPAELKSTASRRTELFASSAAEAGSDDLVAPCFEDLRPGVASSSPLGDVSC